jgi:hypothetical protein
VEFRLIYRGKLPAAGGGDTRSAVKHDIRCQFHKQLKILWKEHSSLREFEVPDYGPNSDRSVADLRADRYDRCNLRFLPFIDPYFGLACSLDILFLRRDEPGGYIVSGGDLDNRLKVLLDGMRIPQTCDEIPSTWKPTADESPLYCVMEDDKLITEIKVTTDRLLLPLEQDEHRHDVVLIISVKTKVVSHQNPLPFFNTYS